MDELNMDSLELPELDSTDYENMADASKAFLDDLPEAKKNVGSTDDDYSYEYDDSEISMPTLSEMDGSQTNAAPIQQPAPAKKAETKAELPSIDDMFTPVQQAEKPQKPAAVKPVQNTSNAYIPTGSSNGTYSGTRSIDDIYAARNAIDPEKFEKGKKRATFIGVGGCILYGINVLSYLGSAFSGTLGISEMLSLVLNIGLLIVTFMFMKGNDKARTFLTYMNLFDEVRGFISLPSAIAAGSLMAAMGGGILSAYLLIILIISLIARGILLYFIAVDENVAEYCKNR